MPAVVVNDLVKSSGGPHVNKRQPQEVAAATSSAELAQTAAAGPTVTLTVVMGLLQLCVFNLEAVTRPVSTEFTKSRTLKISGSEGADCTLAAFCSVDFA